MIGLATLGLSIGFLLIDQAYSQFANAHFPSVGSSAWLATLWGVVSRAHVILGIVPLLVWKPRWLANS